MDEDGFCRRGNIWRSRWWKAALLTVLLGLVPAATSAAEARPQAYYALPGGSSGCARGPLQFCYVAKPTHLAFYGGALSALTWRDWGSQTAVGSGRAIVDLCSPECGEGDVVAGAVRVELRGLRRHGDRRVYSCMITRGPKRAPQFQWGSHCTT